MAGQDIRNGGEGLVPSAKRAATKNQDKFIF